MKKNRKSLIGKLVLFGIFVAILIGKVLFAAFLLFAAKNALAAPTITATEELSRLLNNIQTMQATFEQYVINNKGKMIGDKTKGNMYLSRPGKFRWEITTPNKQLIIINNNIHYVYDADLEQLVKRKANYRNPLSPAMLLSSPVATLQKSFTISKLNTPDQKLWFKLTPKMSENSYQWIEMHFVNNHLRTMRIADNFGQLSAINFNNVVLNTSLSGKLFIFIPPSNTDILEEN